MSSQITTQEKLASVTQFNCQNCGAAHNVMNPRAQYIVCNYCGSVLDAQSEEHKILEQLGNPDKHEPFSFIGLGMSANFDGRAYQVIARTRWRMSYKEYYYEEGESGYSKENWIYDEWLLIDKDYTYFYLVEDKEGYWISNEIIPETPSLLPSNLRMSFYKNQSPKIVREYGQAKVVHFEGESNYTIKKGDEIRFASFKDRGIDYSVEWRMDNKNIKEIEYFQEIPISRRKVIEAFNNNEEIELLKQRESSWKFVLRTAGIAAVVMLLGIVGSLISTGNTAFMATIPLSNFQGDQGIDVGPLKVEEKGNYRLSLSASSLANNAEFFALAFLMDKDSSVLNQVSGEFYYATGYEDGERWTEEKRESSIRFRAEEPGTYFARVYVNTNMLLNQGQLEVRLGKGVMMTRYFAIAFTIFLIISLIGYQRSRP